MNRSYITVLMALSLISCHDDPKLVEKREKQKVEITRLKGEIQVIEEKLKQVPPDVSNDLAKLTKQTEQQKEVLANLQSEVAVLEQKKAVIQKEYDAYRAKYPIK